MKKLTKETFEQYLEYVKNDTKGFAGDDYGDVQIIDEALETTPIGSEFVGLIKDFFLILGASLAVTEPDKVIEKSAFLVRNALGMGISLGRLLYSREVGEGTSEAYPSPAEIDNAVRLRGLDSKEVS